MVEQCIHQCAGVVARADVHSHSRRLREEVQEQEQWKKHMWV